MFAGACVGSTAQSPAHDFKREQFGARDRYTILDVTLDATGAVSAMTLGRSSGLTFLDDEAMAAVRRAAPFEPQRSARRVALS
jgi:TonB family protein